VLERQHEERLTGQRLAVERTEFEAGHAQPQFDACEPEHRLVARTLESRLDVAPAEVERERRKLAELETRRPEPRTPAERQARWRSSSVWILGHSRSAASPLSWTGKADVRLLIFAVTCGSVASRCGEGSEGISRGRADYG
jgi:hypothetical protein